MHGIGATVYRSSDQGGLYLKDSLKSYSYYYSSKEELKL